MYRVIIFFFFSSRRRHTILVSDWSSDVCSSDLMPSPPSPGVPASPWPATSGPFVSTTAAGQPSRTDLVVRQAIRPAGAAGGLRNAADHVDERPQHSAVAHPQPDVLVFVSMVAVLPCRGGSAPVRAIYPAPMRSSSRISARTR